MRGTRVRDEQVFPSRRESELEIWQITLLQCARSDATLFFSFFFVKNCVKVLKIDRTRNLNEAYENQVGSLSREEEK